MKKRNPPIKNAACALLVLVVIVLMPTVGVEGAFFAGSEDEKPSYVHTWVDRGCGGHYRAGEPFSVSFMITSPASHAIVTIRTHKFGDTRYLVRPTEYTTNATHTATGTAQCPAGLETLEIVVTIPLYRLPPEVASTYPDDIHIFDTCHFYVDPPCSTLDGDGDGFYKPYDCDDDNPEIYPGATEVCDEKDNNCNGLIDEGCYTCSGWDRDFDDFADCDDCNDHDHTMYPGAQELCDGKDNDCDGLIDEGCCVCYDDNDRDGFSDCYDCNDSDPTIYLAAPELCDGKDNDCDGFVDEGCRDYVKILVTKGCGAYYAEGELITISFEVRSFASSAVVTIIHYPPQGAPAVWVENRTIVTNEEQRIYRFAQCPMGLNLIIIKAVVNGEDAVTLVDDCGFYVTYCTTRDADSDGYKAIIYGGEDCDDADPFTYPGAEEVCDGKDNDCDGFIDEGFDCHYAEIWVDRQCGGYYNDREPVNIHFRIVSPASTAVVTVTDYPPQMTPTVLAAEKRVSTNKVYTVTGVAQCAGLETVIVTATLIVEGVSMTLTDDCSFFVINCMDPDSDGDGYASVLAGGKDCDDADPATYPGAPELCDGKDNNCDGVVDYPDNDRDGFVAADCGGDDCDDTDASVYPGAEEIYDGKDNNCDGQKDEGITADQIDGDHDGHALTQDCNDSDPAIHPGAFEICDDLKDNDCDGLIDCDDEDCAQHEACEKGFGVADLIDAVRKYRMYVIAAGAGIIAAIVAVYMYLKSKTRIREEVGPPPELEEAPIEKKGPFWRFKRKEKAEPEHEKSITEEMKEKPEKKKKGLFGLFEEEKEEEEEIEIEEDLSDLILKK